MTLTKEKVFEKINEKQQFKTDELVKLDQIYFDTNCYNPSCRVYPVDYGTKDNLSEFTPHAESQLLNRLGIPVAYYNRCPSVLKSDNFNYWVKKLPNKKLMLRFYRERVRAVFSTKYNSDLDDINLFPVVFEALEEVCDLTKDAFIYYFGQGVEHTFMQILFTEQVTYNDNEYMAGISIINSEVGASSIWIRPIIYSSKNYMGSISSSLTISDSSKEGTYSVRHVGQLKPDKIKEAIYNAKRVAHVGIYQLLKASKEILNNPLEEAKELVENSDFLESRIFNIFEEMYEQEEKITKLDFARSMLLAISELPLFKKYKAEQEIGRYLDLFSSTEERFNSIAEDIQQLEYNE